MSGEHRVAHGVIVRAKRGLAMFRVMVNGLICYAGTSHLRSQRRKCTTSSGNLVPSDRSDCKL